MKKLIWALLFFLWAIIALTVCTANARARFFSGDRQVRVNTGDISPTLNTGDIVPSTAGEGNRVNVNDPSLAYAVLAFLALVTFFQMFFQLRRLRLHNKADRRDEEAHRRNGNG